MRLPVDTTHLAFIAAGPPEACVDFDTKRPKVDDNGTQLWQVPLVAMTDGAAEVIAVKVPGEPKGVNQGTPVRLGGLIALPWAMGDRSGVAYRANRLDPIGARDPKAGS